VTGAGFGHLIAMLVDRLVNAVGPDGVVDDVGTVARVERRVERPLVDRVVAPALAAILVAVCNLIVKVEGDATLADAKVRAGERVSRSVQCGPRAALPGLGEGEGEGAHRVGYWPRMSKVSCLRTPN
jgi:hypothetical protein